MESMKKFIFLWVVISSVFNIECAKNEYIVFSQKLIVRDCPVQEAHKPECASPVNPWYISSLTTQTDNSSLECSKPGDKLALNGLPSSVLNDLKEKWSRRGEDKSVTSSRLSEKIWAAYGGCTSQTGGLNNPSQYFSKSYELFNRYNMNNILRQENITQGQSYSYKEFSDAVSKFLGGKKPLLQCQYNRNTDKIELDKITLLFDQTFNLVDPIKNYYDGQCPRHEPFFYNNLELWYNPDQVLDWNTLEYLLSSSLKTYTDRVGKYPTLKEDNNGHYILKLKYEPITCYTEDENKCVAPEYPWTIASFNWEFIDGIHFTCFPDNKNFNPNSLAPIASDLIKKYHAKDISTGPFQNDWFNEGQCSAKFKGLDTEMKFFAKALELYDKFNLDNILRQSNIVAGNNYTGQALADAISKGLNGHNATVFCYGGWTPESNYILGGVVIYLDQSFSPISRSNDNSFITPCPSNETIVYQNSTIMMPGKPPLPAMFDWYK